MKPQHTAVSIAVLMLAVLMLPVPMLQACGPDFTGPTFTAFSAPDLAFDQYARGDLGILQRGYTHFFLYVAYRNLIAKPMTPAEIRRIQPGQPQTDTRQNGSPLDQGANWIDVWTQEQIRVLGTRAVTSFGNHDDSGIFREMRANDYEEYYNCLQPAFQNAVLILHQRLKDFGPESAYTREWVTAQNEVFENCSSITPSIPDPASESDPPLIREDRRYQIAAAYFYAGDFKRARIEFEAIGNDAGSPYRSLARYLVARTLVRKGTLEAGNNYDSQVLRHAEQLLEAILSDNSLVEVHHAARGLLGFVRARLDPAARAQELERLLLSDKPEPDLSQDLTDYLWLLDRRVQDPTGTSPLQATASSKPAVPLSQATQASGDMTDWILTFGGKTPDAYQHALACWQQTKSLPWLVAAISLARWNDPSAAFLEASAREVNPSSPAYQTVTFHRLRLLVDSGHTEEARNALDSILPNQTLRLSRSARNEILALRMAASGSLNDLLKYAPRIPANAGNYPAAQSMGPLFDSDGSVVLSEKLPLKLLAKAAKSETLPVPLRKQVAIAAWTRSILLDDNALAKQLTPVLADLAPELRTSLAQYSDVGNGSAQHFAAVFLILHFPGLRPFVAAGLPRYSFTGPEQLATIDDYRNNWWCLIGPQPKNAPWTLNFYSMYANLDGPLLEIYRSGQIPPLQFLDSAQRANLGSESAKLQSLPSAPTWLVQQVLNRAKSDPGDPRIPEALHFAVRATRYGCVDSKTEVYSKQAFMLLHSRYPASKWTKQTPYWF